MGWFSTNKWGGFSNSETVTKILNNRELNYSLNFVFVVLFIKNWVQIDHIFLTLLIIVSLFLLISIKKFKLFYYTILLLFVSLLLVLSFQKFIYDSFNSEIYIINKTSKGYIVTWNSNKYFLIEKSKLKDGWVYSGNINIVQNKPESKISYSSFHTIGIIKIKNLSAQGKYFSFETAIKDIFINKPLYYKKYFINLIFGYGYYELKNEIQDTFSKLGIFHFIVVSGMHFSFGYFLVNLIFKKLKWEKLKKVISIIFICAYFTISKVSFATLRAFLLLSIWTFTNKAKNNKFCLNLLIMVGIALAVPSSIYSSGFWFTFLISQTIYLFQLFKFKWKIVESILLLITVQINSQILNIWYLEKLNISSFIYVPLLSPVMELSFYVAIIMFPFEKILNFYFGLIDQIFNYLSAYTFLFKVAFINNIHAICLIFLTINFCECMLWKNFCIKK